VSETLWQEGQAESSGDVVSDFVRAIQAGGQPRTSLERALVMQKITDAIYASASSGAGIPVC
jgi:predicted dehydrogenase